MRGAYYVRDNDNMGQDMLNMAEQGVRMFDRLGDYLDKEGVRDSYNRLAGLVKERGGDVNSIDINDLGNMHDWQAFGAMRKQHAENMQNDKNAYANHIQQVLTEYNYEVLPNVQVAMDAYSNGDMNTFMSACERVSNSLRVPYRFKRSQDGKSLDEFFRSNDTGGFTPTGRTYSPQEVMGKFQDLLRGNIPFVAGVGGQQLFYNPSMVNMSLLNMINTERQNFENQMNPRPVMGPDGRPAYVSILNPVRDPKTNQLGYNGPPMAFVFNENGKPRGQMLARDFYAQGYVGINTGGGQRAPARGGRTGRDNGGNLPLMNMPGMGGQPVPSGGGIRVPGFGRGGRGGQGGAADNSQPGPNGAVQPRNLTGTDLRILKDQATKEEYDEQTGKMRKQVDERKMSAMRILVSQGNLDPNLAGDAWEASVAEAMREGRARTREGAEKAVYDLILKKYGHGVGGARNTAPRQNQQGQDNNRPSMPGRLVGLGFQEAPEESSSLQIPQGDQSLGGYDPFFGQGRAMLRRQREAQRPVVDDSSQYDYEW